MENAKFDVIYVAAILGEHFHPDLPAVVIVAVCQK
jgi:hypothetical protein